MTLFFFVLAVVGYSTSASLPFIGKLSKENPTLYYAIGIGLAFILNASWLTLARSLEKDKILIYSIVWDSILTLCYVIAPVLLFGVPTSWKIWAGAGLILSGMVIAKI